MKKIIIAGILVILAISLYYYLYLSPVYRIKPLNMIPPQASFILASDKPVDTWKDISESEAWQHLKRNPQFAEITDNANYLDSLIQANEWLDYMGNKELLIAALPVQDTYDYLYIVDLARASRIKAIKYYIDNIVASSYKVTYREFQEVDIIEFYDLEEKETLYVSFIENLLVVSYSPTLTEAAISQYKNPAKTDRYFLEVTDKLGLEGMFRTYINYNSFMDYLGQFALDNAGMDMLKNSMRYGGYKYEMEADDLALMGITNINDTVNSYLKALYSSGAGGHDFLKVTPLSSPYFVALGFKDLSTFVDNFEGILETDPEQKKAYLENRGLIENFLKIDLDKAFIDWVADEAVMLQTNYSSKNGVNEYALLLKVKDVEDAINGLSLIRQQIKKKTPVKIKSVTYKEHEIHYMAMKGFFRTFLGKLFDKFDKPYYSVINGWVVFSNHPQTIKSIIDAIDEEATLSEDQEFLSHYANLEDKTSVYAYVNMPGLFDDLKPLMEPEDWKDMKANKEYITCFERVSLQLAPEDEGIFNTGLYVRFNTNANAPIAKSPSSSLPAEIQTPEISESTIPWEDLYKKELEEVDRIIIPDLTLSEHQIHYESGQLKYEISLKNGWKHGRFESYFENGSPQFKGKYKDDKKDGTWRIYGEDGELLTKIKYDGGVVEE